jgi:hypothetical protein
MKILPHFLLFSQVPIPRVGPDTIAVAVGLVSAIAASGLDFV